ncbi:MAG: sulfur carrier protein ThiS [Geobacteraceae bacterium]|nr:sulfur carrier protein ThiS [Geobacteraceae bacterium]
MERQVLIEINGERREVLKQSMLELLESLGIDPKRVAVELNMDILPKAEYPGRELAEGDKIEIVHFVGGG